jgi:hypothetical protein
MRQASSNLVLWNRRPFPEPSSEAEVRPNFEVEFSGQADPWSRGRRGRPAWSCLKYPVGFAGVSLLSPCRGTATLRPGAASVQCRRRSPPSSSPTRSTICRHTTLPPPQPSLHCPRLLSPKSLDTSATLAAKSSPTDGTREATPSMNPSLQLLYAPSHSLDCI